MYIFFTLKNAEFYLVVVLGWGKHDIPNSPCGGAYGDGGAACGACFYRYANTSFCGCGEIEAGESE